MSDTHDQRVEKAARVLCELEERQEWEASEHRRDAVQPPSQFEKWREEYVEKARAVLDAASYDQRVELERVAEYVTTARSQILHADISAGPRYAILAKLDCALAVLDAVRPQGTTQAEQMRVALEYLADPENWLGDPHDQTSTLHGHDTPYELAHFALAPADPEAQP